MCCVGPRSRRRGPAELLDNNVLLFGQWYRKLAASKGGTGAGGGQGGEGGGQGDGPELSHLRWQFRNLLFSVSAI